MEGYKATVEYVSTALNVRDKIKFKDTSDAVGIDVALSTLESLVLNIDYYGVLNIHNEKAEGDKDYRTYIFVDTEGNKYYTGSESVWTSFEDIMDELKQEGEEEIPPIKFYKLESKNYKGKYFLTCSIA